MRTLIVADIHGNFPALEAVLATSEAQSCHRIISLGDQVNFGPLPRQVLLRLKELNATMLLGNHEARLLRVDAPEYAGYNWALQRWTHRQLQGLDVAFPTNYAEGSKLFTHGTPGDPFHLIQAEDVPALLESLPAHVTHLFSGHNHAPWLVEHHGRTACNPGSLGMLEDGIGGRAPFVVMKEQNGIIRLTRHIVPYDALAIQRAFIESGCAAAAPEMARVVLHTMLSGEYQATLKLVRFAAGLGDLADPATWQQADRAWPWREPVSTAEYWKHLEEELL